MSHHSIHVDQSSWSQIKVEGDDRIRFLNGMCTANIESLKEGEWTRTCLLTAKGRVVSVFDVVMREEHLLLLCEPQLGDKTVAALQKYAIVDDVTFTPVSGSLHRVWSDPASVWSAPPVLSPPPEPVASPEEVEIRRVEAGFPSYGVDVREDHFPFETPLGQHIDYSKGCYIGQEPVARVYSRGSAQKTLRGLILEGEGPVEVGAQVSHPEKDRAGTVTSSVVSPVFGPIAMAYVHRSAWEPGSAVTVAGRAATVREVPLGAPA